MKKIDNTPSATRRTSTQLKYLSAIVASMMTASVAQADVAGKKIGDLEIYQAAEGGNVTITMMLDTSGSMSLDVVNYACDLPAGTPVIKGSETSTTTPSYIRNYCSTGNRFFYRLDRDEGDWYRCGPQDGSGSVGYGFADCGTRIRRPAIDSSYSYVTSGSNNRYFYISGNKVYDRLTRLKDAMFILMDSPDIDSDTVQIGIGQYSTQSDRGNIYRGADSRTGKILVPAALMNDTQRTKIKETVAVLRGIGGTPTANAYAEAGALNKLLFDCNPII